MRSLAIRSLFGLVLTGALGLGCGESPPAEPHATARDRSTFEPSTAKAALPLSLSWRLGDPDEELPIYVRLDVPAAVTALAPGADPSTPAGRKAVRAQLQRVHEQHLRTVPVLEALGATVDARLSRLTNALQVRIRRADVSRVGAIAGVVGVERVPYYERSLQSALGAVKAAAAWSIGSPLAGDGVSIGIMDTGIDYTHADFGGDGDPATYAANDSDIIEPGTFPTAKVVGGFDFVGDDYNPAGGNSSPKPDTDPLDCFQPENQFIAGGHGSHVAGISAGQGVLIDGTTYDGPYDLSFDPGVFRVAPGVAPRASLYALKVFGCDGGTNAIAAAMEYAADPDGNGDFGDRLDVLNMSLGTAFALGSDTEEEIIANLTTLGMAVVVAAGNDFNTFLSIGAPASYPDAIAVGATQDSNLLAASIDAPASIAGEIPAAEGGFTVRLTTAGPITGTLVASTPADACSAITNDVDMAGNIALIDRGDCTFVDKFARAIDAGAVAVVVIDNQTAEPLFTMGGGDPNQTAIPGVMIRNVDGEEIKDHLAEGVVMTLDGSALIEDLEVLARLSSRGPEARDLLLKPEVSAPGVAIDSAQVGGGIEPRQTSGTSMASPMVAGAVALIKQAKPNWPVKRVKAALMNTAEILSNADGNPFSVSLQGAGRIDAAAAPEQEVFAYAEGDNGAGGVAFGSMIALAPQARTRMVTVDNRGATPVTFDVETELTYPLPGVDVSVEPNALTVGAGETATVTLTLSLKPNELGAPGPDPVTPELVFDNPRHWLTEAAGQLLLTDTAGVSSLHLPFHSSIRAAARRSSQLECRSPLTESQLIELEVGGASAHPSPVTTAFQLGVLDSMDEESATDPEHAVLDILAIGASTSFATDETYEDTSLSFGIAVAGEWSTPALGPLSQVGVLIDVDIDDEPDFVIFAEPLDRQFHTDTLACTTYNLSNGQPTESKRFLNVVPATDYETQPFHNSVVVLSVTAIDLGISPESPFIQYAGFTQGLNTFAGEDTDWTLFDTTRPVVDTSRGGIVPGRPIYVEEEPVKAFVDLEAAGGQPLPKVLLLHHANVAGERFEIVDLEASAGGNLALSVAEAEAEAKVGEVFTSVLDVANLGDFDVSGVTVAGTMTGAELISVTTDQGSCASPPELSCGIGAIAAGEKVSVTIRGRATAGGPTATLDVTATVVSGCDDDDADNTTSTTVALTQEPPVAKLTASGGCGACRTQLGHAESDRQRSLGWLMSGAMVAAWAWRRRRRVVGRQLS